MRCQVLGSLRVEGSDGTEIVVSGEAQRRLIGVLCLHANTPVRSSVLEECLGISAGAVRTSISRLRNLVGSDTLVTTGGYRLQTSVDVAEFESALTEAMGMRPERALDRFVEALALWRGPAFDEFAHEPWAIVESHRLSELHASAVETTAALLIGRGQTGRALAQLEPLVAEHPYRDHPRTLVMLAFSSAGCQTEALRSFQAYRKLLLNDVGVEPSPAMFELDRAIAGGHVDPTPWLERSGLAFQKHPAALPGEPQRKRARNLPVPLTSFVGRATELDVLAELCSVHRLVTITGPGGIGKTRLAMRVCESLSEVHPRGAVWVELGMLTDPSEVDECVARAVGIPVGVDPVGQLVRHFDGSDGLLLVLDNAEHVVGAVADHVSQLIRRCPALRVLVTSRRALGRSGEAIYRVPPMSRPASAARSAKGTPPSDAVDLFVSRAYAVHRGLRLDDQAMAHIHTICDMLDGLPLAIELAAARTRLLPLAAVAGEIADIDRWPDLPTGSTTPRHATLSASIQWSINLIDDHDRRLLTALAVFRTPLSIEAAVAVAPEGMPPDTVRASLGRLVDASLLRLGEANDRFDMLRSVRGFVEGNDQDAELAKARERHAGYYARWCLAVGAGRHGIEHGSMVGEMPEVVAAAQWARQHRPDLAFDICIGLAPIRITLGYNAELSVTWTWLLGFDEHARSEPRWAIAVAALMSWATTSRLDTAHVAIDVASRLPPYAHQARAWLERGRAMVPAYEGRFGPIVAYTERIHAHHAELEESIYAGFASYMLALAGREGESDRQLDRLRRLTRHHRTSFSVDSVGNGYAAGIVNDIVRGDLKTAAGRGICPVPRDAAFSMTSAAALAEVAVLRNDHSTMDRALSWSSLGTLPTLDYMNTFIAACVALLDDDIELAADLADDFAEQAVVVPVSFVHSWPLMNAALLAAGRRAEARAHTASAVALHEHMDPAPYLEAAVLLSRAQIQNHDGDSGLQFTAVRLLTLATDHGFLLRAIDARELLARDAGRFGVTETVHDLTNEAETSRRRHDYRHRLVRR